MPVPGSGSIAANNSTAPDWQWTAKLNGKTVTRRLSETEAKLYQEWISNDRQLRKTITRMRQLAAKASELMITKSANQGQGLIASSESV